MFTSTRYAEDWNKLQLGPVNSSLSMKQIGFKKFVYKQIHLYFANWYWSSSVRNFTFWYVPGFSPTNKHDVNLQANVYVFISYLYLMKFRPRFKVRTRCCQFYLFIDLWHCTRCL